jgi:hypothetical protein
MTALFVYIEIESLYSIHIHFGPVLLYRSSSG